MNAFQSASQYAESEQTEPSGPRQFELSTPSRKRNAEMAGLMPTFVEKKRRGPSHLDSTKTAEMKDTADEIPTPLKRPSTKSKHDYADSY